MKTTLRFLIPAVLSATFVAGCYYEECAVTDAREHAGQAWVQVDAEPPPLRAAVEVRPQRPSATSAWVDGHWDWRGSWVWVDGHWDSPRPGYVWTAPVARRGPSGRIQYHPGHWRPADSQPPPVYREPGEVRVSVRPAARGTVDVQQPRGSVAVQQPGTTQQPGSVTVQQPGQRPGVVVQQPQQPGGVTVQQPGQRPGVVAQQPRSPGATVARPATPGVQTQRPGVTAQQPGRPAPGTTVRPGVTVRPGTTQPGTAQPTGPTVRPAGPAVTRPGTVAPTTPGVRGPTADVRRPTSPGAVSTNPGTVGLGCQLTVTRAPRNGYVTIRGRGWGQSPSVRVGGRAAAVVQRTDDAIRFQMPGGVNGGMVEVSDGGRTARCGQIEVVGR
jgi:hypothetical protein